MTPSGVDVLASTVEAAREHSIPEATTPFDAFAPAPVRSPYQGRRRRIAAGEAATTPAKRHHGFDQDAPLPGRRHRAPQEQHPTQPSTTTRQRRERGRHRA